eukprot:3444404-Pleurochrysis_carterae.AAC.3
MRLACAPTPDFDSVRAQASPRSTYGGRSRHRGHVAAYPMPELPPNWRTATAEDGKEYYYNEITGETSWNIPAIPNPSPDEQKVAPLVTDPAVQSAGADPSLPEHESQEQSNFAQPAHLVHVVPATAVEDNSREDAVVQSRAMQDDADLRIRAPATKLNVSLGDSLPKLLVLAVCSFVVLLQASIEYGQRDLEVSLGGIGTARLETFPRSSTACAPHRQRFQWLQLRN